MEYEQQEDDDFSMSSYDGEQGDSLVIKPPQAVVQKKEKRDKRERRDRHRHKGSHKERHKGNREHRSRDERREHRRHRERDGSRREGRKHDKHREKGLKHDIRSDDLRNKLDKKLAHDREQVHMERHRNEREIYIENRPHEARGSREHVRHREKKLDDQFYESMEDFDLSPREDSEKDKRMQKFLLAEKQKQLSQRDADARRQKREEEKKEEMRIEELRQRAEASMYRRTKRTSESPPHRQEKRLKYAHAAKIPETVELISDDDLNEAGEIVEETQPEPELVDASPPRHDSTPGSDDDREEGDTESSSDSSSEEEEDDEEEDSASNDEERDSERSEGHKARESSLTPSGSSDEDDARTPVHDSKSAEDAAPVSPKKSPVVVKPVLPPYYPAIMGCRSVDEFECLNRIEEGTYGVVYRAREKSTDEIVALKRLKMEKEKEGFPITSLREVNTLLKGQHENIVTVREIVVGSNIDKIYIVMDYVEHDLKSLMETMRGKKQSFTVAEVKALMIQLMKAVHHLHDNWILHRDLKTSNLLLSHRGVLKVGDFGLAREYGSPLKQYTPVVVTLWYRAPELLLGTKEYSCAIDVWSVGCIFGELLGMEAMFPGKSEIDQINKIFKELGSPNDKIWPGFTDFPIVRKTTFGDFPYNHLRERFKERLSDEGFNLLNKFLTYNPSKRITCAEGLEHAYFVKEQPAPVDPAMFPTWPAKSEQGRIKKDSPKPPSGGKNFKDLGKGEDEHMALFFLGGAPKGAGFQLK